MKKLLGVLSVLSMLALATPAFAAGISDARFSNNDTTIDAMGNATVSGTYTLTVGPGEAIEWQRVTVNGLTTDLSIGDTLGKQEGVYHNMPFNGKVPPNTGTLNVDLSGDGIYGANRAISPVDVNANSWMGPVTVGTVRVVANTTSGGSTGDVSVGSDDFWTKLASIFAAALKAAIPPAPVKPACSPLLNGTYQGQSGMNVTSLQVFLISNGFSIAAGATGYYGTQTAGAVAAYRATCQ